MKVPTLPDLILEAVTESAAVAALRKDGAVLWHQDALHKLRAALVKKFNHTARDPVLIDRFCAVMADGLEEGLEVEPLASRLIMFTLLAGTGLNFE